MEDYILLHLNYGSERVKSIKDLAKNGRMITIEMPRLPIIGAAMIEERMSVEWP